MNNREQFESWVSDNGKFQRALERKGDIYLLATINTQWEAWQAASKASGQQLAAVVAENAGLKSNLMFWDADNPELPYEHPDEIAMECEIAYDDTFEVQVAARMPNRKYRVVIMTDDDCQTEQVVSEEIKTPATDAFLAEVRAQGVDMFALMFAEEAIKSNNITTGWRAKASRAASEYAEAIREDAAQLRKGAAL